MCWKQISSHFTIKLHTSRSPIRFFCALVFIVSLDNVSLSLEEEDEDEDEDEEEEEMLIKVNKKFQKSFFFFQTKRRFQTFDRFL
tara:strand:- start:294 stop:548 length:255 start_codon:yes stop_codon:yes gene_type:complete